MNKIFKVVWSKSKECYVVVSEVAKNNGGKKKVLASVMAALVAGTAGAGVTLTADAAGTVQNNANGTGSLAIGTGAQVKDVGNTNAEQTNGIAIGTSAQGNQNSVAIGSNSKTTAFFGTAIGYNAKSDQSSKGSGNYLMSANYGAYVNADNSRYTGDIQAGLASNAGFAHDSNDNDLNSARRGTGVALGSNSYSTSFGTALGDLTHAENSGISIGQYSWSSGASGQAIGVGALSNANFAQAYGRQASAVTAGSVAMGTLARGGSTTAANSAATDKDSAGKVRDAGGSVAVGTAAWATGNRAIAIGGIRATADNLSHPTGQVGTGTGGASRIEGADYNTQAGGEQAIAIGAGARAAQNNSIAQGTNATVGYVTADGDPATNKYADYKYTTGDLDIFNNNARIIATETVEDTAGKNVNFDSNNPTQNGHIYNAGNSIALGNDSVVGRATNATAIAGAHISDGAHYSIAIGDGALAGNASSGAGANGYASDSVAIGHSATVNSRESVALGTGANVTQNALRAVAIGPAASAGAIDTVAIGTFAKAQENASVALGVDSTANTRSTSQKFAYNEASGRARGYQGNGVGANNNYRALFNASYEPGQVSVGYDGYFRQITNVQGGSDDHDAVNVAQLKNVNLRVSGDSNTATITSGSQTLTNQPADMLLYNGTLNVKGDENRISTTTSNTGTADADINVKFDYDGLVKNAAGSNVTVTQKDDNGKTYFEVSGGKTYLANGTNTTVTGTGTDTDQYKVNVEGALKGITSIQNGDNGGKIAFTDGGTTISGGPVNVSNQQIKGVADGTKDSDAVNLGQLNAAKYDFKTNAIANGGTLVGTAAATTVNKGTTVNYAAGKNLTVKQDVNASTGEQTYTYALAKDVDLGDDGSLKAGDTKITTDGLTITGGPSVTKTGGINAGGKVISNVAAGSKDTDAVNVSQLKTKIGDNNIVLGADSTVTSTQTLAQAGGIRFNVKGDGTGASGANQYINTTASGSDIKVDLTDDAKSKLNHTYNVTSSNGTVNVTSKTENNVTTFDLKVQPATATTSTWTAKSSAEANTTGKHEGQNSQVIADTKSVDFQAGKNLTVKQTNDNDGNTTINYSLSDDITVGKDGANGVDGKVGVKGADGSGVVINGKDGSIGLNGTNGTNGLTIKGDKGENGVDGTDGNNGTNGMTRIVYTDGNNKTHQVATLDDGMKYGGDMGTTQNVKLNKQVDVKGGITNTADLATGNNIGVTAEAGANGGATLNVQLAKDLTGLNSITGGNNSGKITFTTPSVANNNAGVTISGGNLSLGDGTTNNKIVNLAPGTNGTDAVNVDQLNAVKAAEKHITPGTYTVGSKDKRTDAANDEVTLTYTNGDGNEVPNSYAVIKGIAKSDLSNITDDGKKVITGLGTKVNAGDNVTVDENKDQTTGQMTYTVNAKLAKVEDGKNTTVEGTGTDAAPYKVNVQGALSDISSITNGAGSGKISFGENGVVNIGSGNTGAPSISLNGNTGDITGLTNKTLTSPDFGTKGRAATEEQLKIVNNGFNNTINLGADTGATTQLQLNNNGGIKFNIKGDGTGTATAAGVATNKYINTTASGTDIKVDLTDDAKAKLNHTYVVEGVGSNVHVTEDTNTAGKTIYKVAVDQVAPTAASTESVVKKAATAGDTNIANVTVADGKTTGDQNAQYEVSVSKNDVKDAAREAVTVNNGGDTNNPITVEADPDDTNHTTNYKVTFDGDKAAKQIPLTYKANGKDAQTVKLSDGLNFTDGNYTKASVGADGVVKYDVTLGDAPTYTDGKPGTPGKDGAPGKDGIATISKVVDIVNNAGWNANATGNTTATPTKTTVKPGDTVNFDAGKNLQVTQTVTGTTQTYSFKLNKDVDLGDTGSLKAGNTTVNNGGVTITAPAGGTTTDVKLTNTGLDNGGNKIVNVADGDVNANSKDAVNGSQLYAVKAAERHIKPDTYAVGNDGTVTMTYVDGDGKDVANTKAVITGIAKQDLSNITNDGKQVITGLGTKVAAGDNVTVDENKDQTTGQMTYTVNAKLAKVAAGKNTTVEGTGTDADPYKVNVQGALSDISSITNGTGSGKISFGDNGVVNIGSGTAGQPNITLNGSTGRIGGLTNKTFDPNNFTSGQAATEDQLSSVHNTLKASELHIAPTAGTTETKGGEANAAGTENTYKYNAATKRVELTYNDGNGNAVANTKAVIDLSALAGSIDNYGGFNVKSSATDGKVADGSQGEQNIASGKTVEMQAGKNLTIKQTNTNGNAQVEYSLANDISIGEKGEPGTPGKDGVDGKIGVNGKDGSAVVINGKDGSIGLNGKDGKNGISIKGQDGAVGVDGKDGVTRVVYTEKVPDPANPGQTIDKTHEIATTDDGLHFGGDMGTVQSVKLNKQVDVKGGITDATKLATGNNIGVTAGTDATTGTPTLNVQLAKDITGLNSVTTNEVRLGDTNNYTTVKKDGDTIKYTTDGGTNKTIATTDQLWKIQANGKTVEPVNGLVNVKAGDNVSITSDAATGSMTVNAVTPAVYTDRDGNKVYKIVDQAGNTTWNTNPNGGAATKVQPGDVITSFENPNADTSNGGKTTTDGGMIVNNVGSAINNHATPNVPAGQDATFLDKLDAAADDTKTQNAAVNVSDLKKTADGLTDKGLVFDANNADPQTNKLGSKVTVAGTGTLTAGKAFADEYNTGNIRTNITQDADGNTLIAVGMAKDLAGVNSITGGNNSGKITFTTPDTANKGVGVTISGGNLSMGDGTTNNKIVNLAPGVDGTDAVNVNQLKSTEQHIAPQTYTVGNDKVVTMTYVDGNGQQVKDANGDAVTAKIDLSSLPSGTMSGFNVKSTGNTTADSESAAKNITDGKTVEMVAGKNLTVKQTSDTNGAKVEFALGTELKNLDKVVVNGVNGQDGKDGVTITGPSGTPGQDGNNGKVGISGANGKDAVSISGKDGIGHIGLTGEAGKDGRDATADIITKIGQNGVDGTDGNNGKDGMTRIVYTDNNNKTHEVATMEDGLRFTGNNTGTENKQKLNSLVKVQGEGTKAGTDATGAEEIQNPDGTKFESATGNIAVEANGTDTLTVKLNKNLSGLNSVQTKTIELGDPGNTTTIAKDGDRITYTTNNGGNTVTNKIANLGDEKHIKAGTYNVDNNGTVTLNYQDGNNTDLTETAVITGIAKQDLSNITKGGETKIQNLAKDAINMENGKNTVASNRDVNGVKTFKVDVEGDLSGITSITNNAGSGSISFEPNSVVKVGGNNSISLDGGNGHIGGLTNKTFDPNNFTTGQAATEDQLKQVSDSIKNYDGFNVKSSATTGGTVATGSAAAQKIATGKTVEMQAGRNLTIKQTNNDGNAQVEFALNKELSNLDKVVVNGVNGQDGKDGVTIVGPSGTPGQDGNNGKVGISGANGKDAVSISGKDGVGHIGLTGEAGKDGRDATADIITKIGQNGVDGTDGNNGKDGMTRIVYTDNNNKTHEVATMEDGLKFAGDDGQNDATKAIAKKLNETVDIIGGADKNSLTDNNIGVNNDNGKLKVQLAKDIDLTDDGSVTTGNTKVNNDGITIKAPTGGTTTNVTLTNTGLDNGGNVIKNVANGVDDHDAVNVSQLNDSKFAFKTNATGNTVGTTPTATSVAKNATINYAAGKNLTVEQTIATNGDQTYTYALGTELKNLDTIVVNGKNGQDGKDGVTITGPNGQNGANGVDGKVGISGKDGRDAVSIAGKDGVGHIGLQGPKGQDGTPGADGANIDISTDNGTQTLVRPETNNGDKSQRIVYVPRDKDGNPLKDADGKDITREVATMDDGLRFTGNDESKVNTHKLNTTVKIQGEGVTAAQSKTFASAGGNINVVADENSTLTVQLAKNINLGNDGSVTTGNTKVDNSGITITNADPNKTVSLTGDGLNNGGNQIKNVAAGKDDTDAVNVKQLKDKVTTVTSSNNSIKVVDTNTGANADPNKGHTYDITIDNQSVVDNAQTPVVYTDKDGHKLYLVDGKFYPNADGTGTEVPAADVIASMNNGAGSTTTPMILNNVGSAIKDESGTTFLDKLNAANTNNPNAAVNVSDLKQTADAIGTKGLNFGTQSTGANAVIHKDLGDQLDIVGEGTKADDQYDASNIKTMTKDGKVVVALDKNLKAETVTITGKDGKDGSIGINGKDGTSHTIKVVEDGTPGVNGKDGTTRIIIDNKPIANLDDGMKFAGDDGQTDATKAIGKKLNETVDIVGGADKANLTDKNIGVNNVDGKLKVQLSKDIDLTKDGSVKIGDTTVNNDGVKVGGNVSLTKDGLTAGDTTINNDGFKNGNTTVGGNGITITNTGDANKTVSLTDKGLNNGGNQIKNVAAGTEDTDAVNVSQLKQAAAASKTTVEAGDNNVKVEHTTEADGHTNYKVSLNPVVSIGDNNPVKIDGNTGDITGLTNKTIDGPDFATKGRAATEEQLQAMGNKGLNFGAQSGTDIHKNLGDKLEIVGEGAKADSEYDASNIKTMTKDGKVVIALDKNLKADTVTVGGRDGKDGKDGVDGQIGVNGKDGSAVVINGKDGSIGLNGKDGANGISIKGQDGKVGLDGKDGETRMVYVEKDNPGKTHEIATTDDGLHFGGDMGTTAGVKLNKQVDIKGGITDASKLATGNNIGITSAQNGDNATLTVQLAKDLQGINSIRNTTNGPSLNFGGNEIAINGGTLNMGGNKITNVGKGVNPTDVATVGQLTKVQSADGSVQVTNVGTESEPNYDLSVRGAYDPRVDQLSEEIGRVGAQGAALAALKPIQYDPLEPTQIMAGYGNYRGNSALALGVAHYKNESTMIHGGVSWAGGSSHMMANAGVTWKVGSRDSEAAVADRYRKGPVSSTYAMQSEMAAMKAQNAGLKGEVADLKAENEQMKAQIAAMMAKLGL